MHEAFGGNPGNVGDPMGDYLVVITTTSANNAIPTDQGIRHPFGYSDKAMTATQKDDFKTRVKQAILEGKKIANEKEEYFDLALEAHAGQTSVRDAFREVLLEIYKNEIYFKIRSLTFFYCFSNKREKKWYDLYQKKFDIDVMITVPGNYYSIGTIENMSSTGYDILINQKGGQNNVNLLDYLNTLGRKLPPLPKEE